MVPLCFGVLSLPGCAHRTGGALDFPTFSCITDLLKIKCLYSEFMLTLKVLVLNSQKKTNSLFANLWKWSAHTGYTDWSSHVISYEARTSLIFFVHWSKISLGHSSPLIFLNNKVSWVVEFVTRKLKMVWCCNLK